MQINACGVSFRGGMRLPAMGDFVCLEFHILEAIKLPQGGHPVTNLADQGLFCRSSRRAIFVLTVPPKRLPRRAVRGLGAHSTHQLDLHKR